MTLITYNRRYSLLGEKLSLQDKISPTELAQLSKEYSDLSKIVSLVDKRNDCIKSISDLQVIELEEKKRLMYLVLSSAARNYCQDYQM